MKKKILIILTSLIIIVCGSYFAFAKLSSSNKPVKPSEYGIGMSLEEALKDTSKPIVAMFYADWCTYCMRFMPTMEKLSKEYKDKYNFVMIDGDSKGNELMMRAFRVGGFPTLYIIDTAIDYQAHIPATSYVEKAYMNDELDRYLRVRKLMNCNIAEQK